MTKPHIFEADLHDAPLRLQCPHFSEIFASDALGAALNAALPALRLELGPKAKVCVCVCVPER